MSVASIRKEATVSEQEKAVEYLTSHKIGETLQLSINKLYLAQPPSVYGFLCDYLEAFSEKPTINLVSGFVVFSQHSSTERIRIKVTCNVKNHTEEGEQVTVGYNSSDEPMSLDDLKAVNDALIGLCVFEQEAIDTQLEKLEGVPRCMKLAVSMAVFKTATRLLNMTLVDRLRTLLEKESISSPLPSVSIFKNGKAHQGKVNIGEVVIVGSPQRGYSKNMENLRAIFNKVEENIGKKAGPQKSSSGCYVFAADRLEAMLDIIKESAHELELIPEQDFSFLIDVRANNFYTEVLPGTGSAKKQGSGKKKGATPKGKRMSTANPTSRHRYDWIEGQVKTSEDLSDYLENLINTENVVAVIDPFHHEDQEGYDKLSEAIGERCHILSRMKTTSSKVVSQVHSFQDTLSATIQSFKDCQNALTLLEPHQYEEGEDILADLAMANNCHIALLGGVRGVRQSLHNRVSQLVQEVPIPVPSALPEWQFPVPAEPTPVPSTEDPEQAPEEGAGVAPVDKTPQTPPGDAAE